jgi:hypothetical protein
VSEGITSVLSALGFLNPGLHLMQTLFIFLNLEQSSQLLRILLITCNFSFTSLWDIQSLQQTVLGTKRSVSTLKQAKIPGGRVVGE